MVETHKPQPDLPPPASTVGVLGWMRQHLFSSWLNTALTAFALYLLYITLVPLISWAFINADWVGDSRDACTSGGACWVFIGVRFKQFMYGFYPEAEQWRVNWTGLLFVLLMIPMFIKSFPKKAWLGAFILIVYPVIAYLLLSGGSFGLPLVETSLWGGLLLTLVLSAVGIAVFFRKKWL